MLARVSPSVSNISPSPLLSLSTWYTAVADELAGMKSIFIGGSSGFSMSTFFFPAALYSASLCLYSITSASLISRRRSWIGSTRCRQRLSRPFPDDALAVTKRKRLG